MALLVGALMLMAGCSVRLDVPPDPVPSPGPAEQIRQAQALASEHLADLATAAAGTAPADLAPAMTEIATAAQTQLDALGGVWSPPPRPEDPSPTAPGAAAPDDAAPAEVVSALVESATTARAAVADPAVDPSLASVLSAIVVQREAAADHVAGLLGIDPGLAEPEPALPDTLTAAAAGLCRTLDALGYAGETLAARSGGEERSRAAQQARADRDLSERIAVAAGLAGTASDPREASYAVDDPEQDMATWRAALVTGWLAQVPAAEPGERAGVLDHARLAARTAPPDHTEALTGQTPTGD
ncbi:hypothetical protein LQF12_06205 [Ruania suaedae]|uniref:hypothetical protein n=1 Tax=Ruania suaedae TaxID=2897774 RepID=UPI001E2A838E|nr:hypothetical protein [Ruania suaedae]UFU04171.1 hypothetical protein LQF12_06205 [Ruania suaedae]